VKLSGLVTRAYPDRVPPRLLRSWAQVLLDGFGPDRMMFGSDWPVCTLSPCSQVPPPGSTSCLKKAKTRIRPNGSVFHRGRERDFWRNVRTHPLHDPVAYKRREVGLHYLTGEPRNSRSTRSVSAEAPT
jgi:hypothetical protein